MRSLMGGAPVSGSWGAKLRISAEFFRRLPVVLSLALGLLGVLLLAPSSAAALPPISGTPWYWASPQPSGAELYGVAAVGSDFWAVGAAGTILHSADGGQSWAQQISGTTATLDSVTFVDALAGWAVGGGHYFIPSAKIILHTTDGGLSWAKQTLPAGARALHGVTFLDRQRGWAVGSRGTILRTTNGGASWKKQVVKGVADDLWCVAFTNRRSGLIGGPRGGYLRTTDGGLTWQKFTLPGWRDSGGEPEAVVDVVFRDSLHGYALFGIRVDNYVVGERLYRTVDGGRRWTRMVWPRGVERIGSLAIDQVGRLCALGYLGDDWSPAWTPVFLRARSGDRSWQRSRWSCGLVTDMAAGQAGSVAVGETIVASADGLRWYARSSTAVGFADLDMLDAAHGWAIGFLSDRIPSLAEEEDDEGAGAVAADVVAGARAQALGAGHEAPDASGAALDVADEVPPAGGDSFVSFSEDGVRWREIAILPDTALNAVDFVDALHGWATDACSGTLYETADGGRTWVPRVLETSTLTEVQFVDAEHGWVSGMFYTGYDELDLPIWEGVVFITTDGGLTWTRHSLGEDLGGGSLCFIDAQHGWLGSEGWMNSQVLKTSDGGLTWSAHNAPFGSLLDVDFCDELHGWGIGDDGYEWPDPTVFKTTDGGLTWREVFAPPVFGNQACVQAIDGDSVRVLGTGIWRTDTSGGTWRCEAPSLALISFSALDAERLWAAGWGLVSTVDVAGDTATPATLTNADDRWHALPYTVRLRAADIGGSGLAGSEYRLDEQTEWQATGGEITFSAAPGDHSLDGYRRLFYRSTDTAGNIEPTQIALVRIDTTQPVVTAPRAVTRTSGQWGYLPVAVTDIPGAEVTLTARIYNASGQLVKKVVGRRPELAASGMQVWFLCSLRPGRYRFQVSAVDAAGNRQSVCGVNSLVVL